MTKRKWILAGILSTIGFALSVVGAGYGNRWLTGETQAVTAQSFFVWHNKGQLLLFFALLAVSGLGICAIISDSAIKHVRSQTVKITSDIATPLPAGQGQFGSARWLTAKEKQKLSELKAPLHLKISGAAVQRLLQNSKTVREQIRTKGHSAVSPKLEPVDYQPFAEGGVVIGMEKRRKEEILYTVRGDLHTLTLGATRSGKSRNLVIPSMATTALSGESMVFSDPKGELYQYSCDFLESLGYEVIAIDFKTPSKSFGYNFLQPAIDCINDPETRDVAKAIERVMDIVALLVPDNDKTEPIWINGQRAVLGASILSVIYDNREKVNHKYQNLTNVYKFLAEMATPIKVKKGPAVVDITPLSLYIDLMQQNEPEHPALSFLAISGIAPDKTKGSFDVSALTTLMLFASTNIYGMSRASSYDPRALGQKKMAIFIILPDDRATYYPLAALLVAQHYQMLVELADSRGGRLPHRVNFFLDEFGNFTKIPDFDKMLTVAGGRGVRFNIFLQSISQLKNHYGEETSRTIRGNCQVWTYLKSDDMETLEELSKKLGKYTTTSYSVSNNFGTNGAAGGGSASVNLTERALLTPDEIAKIQRPYTLVTTAAGPAIFHAPDLSQWFYNKLLALGDPQHNTQLRAYREAVRQQRSACTKIDYWGVWETYQQAIKGGLSD